MHDYIIRSLFTTKLRLREILSTVSGTFVLFSQGRSFHLCCFGNLLTIKLSICVFKARLASEICFSDAIIHKGYSLKEMHLQSIVVFVSIMVDWVFVLMNTSTMIPRAPPPCLIEGITLIAIISGMTCKRGERVISALY